jgi:predicted nucleic acid-binding protein
MTDKVPRVYTDTSVIGGVFDEEFSESSRSFFYNVDNGLIVLVLSSVVCEEIKSAPGYVKEYFEDMRYNSEFIEVTKEAIILQHAYIDSNILGSKWMADALHVALATVSNCNLIVSWNFKHIVNYQKILKYNKVNEQLGYKPIAIHSPLEVNFDEN